jgi:hypothetical protein
MIVYDLSCDNGHGFEGWFGSSTDFARQQERGLVTCPHCGSAVVTKAPMAPAVPRKGNQVSEPQGASAPTQQPGPVMTGGPIPPEVRQALDALAQAQAKALAGSQWVGNRFADNARAMHYGERDPAPIHGQTSLDEAQKLREEGIEVLPLPFPVTPPDELN